MFEKNTFLRTRQSAFNIYLPSKQVPLALAASARQWDPSSKETAVDLHLRE